MAEQPNKRGRGCLFYVLVVGGILALIILAGALGGLCTARKMVRDYTDPQPVILPTVNLSQDQFEELQDRVATFQQALRQQRRTDPLVLTADELNVLLATTPAAQSLSNKLHVRIEGDTLKGDLSLPLEALGLPVFRDRYLNGTATFGVELKDGHLELRTQRLLVKGKNLPRVYMDKIRGQNLAEKVNSDPRASMALENLQEVRVHDGKLQVVPKNMP
jgi:hypothetical protein